MGQILCGRDFPYRPLGESADTMLQLGFKAILTRSAAAMPLVCCRAWAENRLVEWIWHSLRDQPRVHKANAKSKTPLETYVC
jgi:hypothetical protein